MNGTTTALHQLARFPPPVQPLRSPTSATSKTSPSAAQFKCSPFSTTTTPPVVPSTKRMPDRQSTHQTVTVSAFAPQFQRTALPSVHPALPLKKSYKRFAAAHQNAELLHGKESLRVSTEDSQGVEEEEAKESFTQFSSSPVYFPIELGSSFNSSTLHNTEYSTFPTMESTLASPAPSHRHHDSLSSSTTTTNSTVSSSTTPSHSSRSSLTSTTSTPDFATFQTPSPSKTRHTAHYLNLPRAVPLRDFDPVSPVKSATKLSGSRGVGRTRMMRENKVSEKVLSESVGNSFPRGSPPALLSVLIQKHRDSLGSIPDGDHLPSSSSLLSSFASPVLPTPSLSSTHGELDARRAEEDEEENELANEHEERLREGKLTLEADEDKVDRRLFETAHAVQENNDAEEIYNSEEDSEDEDSEEEQDVDIKENFANYANPIELDDIPNRLIRAASCNDASAPKTEVVDEIYFNIPADIRDRRSLPVMMPCSQCHRYQAGGNVNLNGDDLYACKCNQTNEQQSLERRRINNQQRKCKPDFGEEQPVLNSQVNGCEDLESVASTEDVIGPLSNLSLRSSRATSSVSSIAHSAVSMHTARPCLPVLAEGEDDGILVDSSVMQFELDL